MISRAPAPASPRAPAFSFHRGGHGIHASLFFYTTHKLQRMRMVRGETEGGRFVEGTVSRKWETARKRGPAHWLHIKYSAEDGSRTSCQTNVGEPLWNSLATGSPIRLALLPDGTVELPDGIWASDGNMVFDRILRRLELLAAVVLGAAAAACFYFATRRPTRIDRPKEPGMTLDGFWAIVDRAREESGGDDEIFIEKVRARLKNLSPEEIVAFDIHFDALRFRAYRKELWGAAYLVNGGCSDDGFEYFRAWLISLGKRVYEQTLSDPDSLAAVCDPDRDDHELEDFLYLAEEAYESRTGRPLPDRKRAFPALTGRDWEEDQLESLYPRIAAKRNGDGR